LFLVGGMIERRRGTTDLNRLSGLATSEPVIAGLFLVAALSLAGVPPSSGFVGKLALVQGGLAAEQYAVVGVSLAVSLLTLSSMTKIWTSAFWGPSSTEAEDEIDRYRGSGWMTAGTAILVVAAVSVALAAGPLHTYCERAAADLLQPTTYI